MHANTRWKPKILMGIVTLTGTVLLCVGTMRSMAQGVGRDPAAMTEQIRARIRSEGCNIPAQLEELLGQNAEERLASAIARSDFRYIAVSRANSTIDVPGVSYSFDLCPIEANQVQLFDDTAAPSSRCSVHNILLRSLNAFGGQFNPLLEAERARRGLGTCTR